MSAISSVNSSAVSDAVTSQTGSSTLDKEAFMLLLVTQFQYQDPLNPMEDKEFIAQLAQFSSLEQMMNMNDSMVGLTEATKNQEMINATSYIGKNVDVSGNVINKQTDADGDVTVSGMLYALGETAVAGTVRVFDSNGNEVYKETLTPKSAGTHPFTWDGKTTDGTYAADGSYQVTLEVFNDEGDSLMYDSVVDGLVTGVSSDDGTTYLYLSGGRTTALSDVRRVSEPTVIGNVNTDSDTDTDDGTNSDTNTGSSTDTGSSTGDGTNTDGGTSTGTDSGSGSGSQTTP